MTRLPTPDQHAYMLSIGEQKYTQDQAGELAFKCYLHADKEIKGGFDMWKRLVWPNDYTEKDWLFLVLYFLSEIADDTTKEAHAKDMEIVKEAVR